MSIHVGSRLTAATRATSVVRPLPRVRLVGSMNPAVAAAILSVALATGSGLAAPLPSAVPLQDAQAQYDRAAAAAMAERGAFVEQLVDGVLVSTEPEHYETAIQWQQEFITQAIEAQRFDEVARLAEGIDVLEGKLDSVRMLLDYAEQMRVANEAGDFARVGQLAELAQEVRLSLGPAVVEPRAGLEATEPARPVPETPSQVPVENLPSPAVSELTEDDVASLNALREALAVEARPTDVVTSEQAELGRVLLEDGVEGLRDAMSEAGVPALTFNQETQVRTVHNSHVRVLEDLLAGSGGGRAAVEPEVSALEEQLLLATLKFLNPAQRTGLIGATASAAFAELNSDLPEDEAELREYLADLRSPAGTEGNNNNGGFSIGGGGGGGGGGGLLIDGFSGGRMPNRDEIQEIRINENSFTSEQSGQSRGRTEVITRGGVGRFNGDVTFNFGDESLDARNAFASFRPPYQQRNFNANVSGPVIPNRLTMTFSLTNDTAETGQTLRALTPDGLVSDAIVRPNWQKSYTTRGTVQLSENNNLNTSYTFGTQRSENQNVGQLGLPEQGSMNSRDNFTFQIKETAVLSQSINNEVRFQHTGFMQDQDPLVDAPHIDVLGAFRAGGSPNKRESKVRQYDFGNLTMFTGDRLAVRLGFDGGYSTLNSDSQNNFNGTYTFNSLFDYCSIAPGEGTKPECVIEIANQPGVTPIGPTYSISQGNPVLVVEQWQSAGFVQTDWRATPAFTLSLGARYEWQTNLDDYNNIDPRLGFALQLGSNTVLRGGTGTFHQRLAFFAVTDLLRNDGLNQQLLEISESSFPADPGELTLLPTSIRVRAPELTAPYTWNSQMSIETELGAGIVVTGSYNFIRGIHLYRDRNLNAPFDSTAPTIQSCYRDQDILAPGTCIRPDPTSSNINQYESTGTSNSHTFRFGFRQRLSFLNLNGSYDFDSTYDDLPASDGGNFGGGGGRGGGGNFQGGGGGGGGNIRLPADNYDLDSEWGRSGARHSANFSASFRFPWDVNIATIFDWSTGSPYTWLSGRDDNLDTTRNDRAIDPETGFPRSKNTLDGPGFFETSLNFSKAIQLRSDQVEVAAAGTGGFYGQRTGLRMTISANVTNLLNNVNFSSFNGVETSSFFMLPTSARNPRQITGSVRFDF